MDPVFKSPKKTNWEGESRREGVNDKEIEFILTKPYTPFLSTLTLGYIAKKYLGKSFFCFGVSFLVNSTLTPIGSGPYEVEKNIRNSMAFQIELLLFLPLEKICAGTAWASERWF